MGSDLAYTPISSNGFVTITAATGDLSYNTQTIFKNYIEVKCRNQFLNTQILHYRTC